MNKKVDGYEHHGKICTASFSTQKSYAKIFQGLIFCGESYLEELHPLQDKILTRGLGRKDARSH